MLVLPMSEHLLPHSRVAQGLLLGLAGKGGQCAAGRVPAAPCPVTVPPAGVQAGGTEAVTPRIRKSHQCDPQQSETQGVCWVGAADVL